MAATSSSFGGEAPAMCPGLHLCASLNMPAKRPKAPKLAHLVSLDTLRMPLPPAAHGDPTTCARSYRSFSAGSCHRPSPRPQPHLSLIVSNAVSCVTCKDNCVRASRREDGSNAQVVLKVFVHVDASLKQLPGSCAVFDLGLRPKKASHGTQRALSPMWGHEMENPPLCLIPTLPLDAGRIFCAKYGQDLVEHR